MSANNFIVIDWGSSNIRAFLYTDGKQQEIRKSSEGVTVAQGRQCETVFERLTSDWFERQGPMPVLMSGMVGSINGWCNADYLKCPLELNDLGKYLTRVENRKEYDIRIVPGLCVNESGNYNVMRGEETQLLGAMKKQSSRIYIMPGTHCKWVLTDGKRIETFRTVMTGELLNILMKHSLIGLGNDEQVESEEVFMQGLEHGVGKNSILTSLFEVRAAKILGGISSCHVKEYLSGLLIGSEIATLKRLYSFSKDDGDFGIIASPMLAERYAKGLQLAGISSFSLNGDDAFLKGILPLVEALN